MPSVSDNGDGTQEIREDDPLDAAPVSEARRTAKSRLAKSRAGLLERGEKRFEFVQTEDGEIFYIKRLTWPETARCHFSAGRSPGGTLLMEDDANDLRALTIAALSECVYTEADSSAKYFETVEDAAEYVDSEDSELQNQVRVLFDYALAATPLLLPKLIQMMRIPWKENRISEPSPETSDTGLTLTTTNGETGGNETLGIDTQDISPAEKGDSPTISTETPST